MEQLTCAYGTVRALSSITFAIETGERVAITGARGSGRSTLLAVLAGRRPFSAGLVTVDGIDVMRDPFAARRRVSCIAPIRWRRTGMRVREYLALLAGSWRIAQAAAAAALEESRLDGERTLQYLSGEEQARLMLALATMSTAPVLLLDDVVKGSDSAAWARLLAKARDRGATIVVTADSARDLPGLWDRTLVLDAGRMVATSAQSAVAVSPGTDASAALVVHA